MQYEKYFAHFESDALAILSVLSVFSPSVSFFFDVLLPHDSIDSVGKKKRSLSASANWFRLFFCDL